MTSKTLLFCQRLNLTSYLHLRKCSSAPKYKLVDEVGKLLEEEKIKPRKHPGIIRNRVMELPEWLVKAIDQSLDDVNRPQLLKERVKFANYLFSRRLPLESLELQSKYKEIEKGFIQNVSDLSEEEYLEKQKKVKNQVNFKLKEKVFAWKPLEYKQYQSLLYLITRSTAEYSVLNQIFHEIQIRDPDFEPTTVFDFGSGVGTVLWAALDRWKKINEYLAIDISNEMNELSQNIINHRPFKFKKTFYRQYLPVSNLKFDLVVSAYSLMELPDAKNRLAVISKLWRKTNKYLVIVEQGTNAGFKAVNEAREFIKHIEKKKENSNYFTFAPCSHDLDCPRFLEGKTPCNFMARYMSLPLLGPQNPKEELYSYVVLKKGCRGDNDQWQRVVRKTMRRSKHVWCQLCTSDGKLEKSAFFKSKCERPLFRCIRASKWGDRVPILPNSHLDASTETNVQDIKETDPTSESEMENKIEDESDDSDIEGSESDECDNEVKNEKSNKKFISSEAPFSYKKDDL